tara:strand:- start:5574 stop:6965 length:1392 start_codon:yes stop_codon:yes gene_type:complete
MVVVVYVLLMVSAILEPNLGLPIWPYLGTGLFVLFVRIMFRRHPRGMAILTPLVITRILLLFSLVFIAQRFFIRELGIIGEGPVYACYFALISCIFLHLTILTFDILVRNAPPRPANPHPLAKYLFATIAIIAGLFATITLLYTGAHSGFALLDGTDRFAFRANQGWLFNVIITFKPIICAMLGFVRFRIRFSAVIRAIFTSVFVVLLLSSALFGDKFLSLIVMIVYFFMPYLILEGRIDKRMRVAGLAVLLLGGSIVSGLTYYTYSDYGRLSFEETSERLFGRFTGQGQLWYAVNNREVGLTVGDPAEAQRLKNVMLASSGADDLAFRTRTGIFQMVQRFAPSSIQHAVFGREGLVQFTGAGEAYLSLVFGQTGMLIFIVILAIGCGASVYYVYNSSINGSLVGFVFSIFIVANYSSMVNQGSFWQIYGVRSLFYITVMISLDLLSRVLVNQIPTRRVIKGR